MLGILLGIAAADVLILVRSGAAGAYLQRELERMTEGVLTLRAVHVALDGTATAEGAVVALGDVRLAEAGHVEIEADLRRLRVSRVRLRDVRLRVSDAALDALSKKLKAADPTKKTSIRDLLPDPDVIPKIELDGGTLEVDLAAVTAAGKPLAVTLERITASITNGYRLHVSGGFGSGLIGAWRGAGDVDLEVGGLRLGFETEGWAITPALRDALAPGPRDVYDKYKPAGRADLRVELAQDPGQDLDFRATLKPRGMSLYYRHFPYQVERAEGELEFRADGFRIKHMEARQGSAAFRFDGFSDGYDAAAGYVFRVEVDDIPLDARLRSALKEDAQRVWDLFGPSGRASARGRVLRIRGKDTRETIPLDIRLADAGMKYKNFPYELKGLAGDLFFDGDDAVVRKLRTQEGPTSLEISGSVRSITADPVVDLRVEGEAVPLDKKLREALPEKPRAIFDAFAPSGAVDLRWWVRKAAGKDVETGGRARARGNDLTWKEIPLPASELQGEVELDETGKVSLHHLSGKVAGAEVEVHGTVTDALTCLHVDATGLSLDPEVRWALPANLRKVIDGLKLYGTVSFNSTVKMKKDGESQADVLLRLTKGIVETVPRFEDLEGTLALTCFMGATSQMQGSVSLTRASILGKRLTDVTASLNMNGPQLNFVNLKATAYGGVLTGESFGMNVDTGVFFGRLFTVDRLDLAEFAADTAGFRQKALAGKASLELRDLQGTAGDGATLSGSGRMKIRDAAIWDIPIFLSVFQLNPQDLFKGKNAFEAGAIDFELKGKRFQIAKLAFTSDTSSIVGHGRIDFSGEMHLYLRPHSGRLLGIDFFVLNWTAEFLGLFTGAIMGVEVTGSFDKPETSIKPFQGFK